MGSISEEIEVYCADKCVTELKEIEYDGENIVLIFFYREIDEAEGEDFDYDEVKNKIEAQNNQKLESKMEKILIEERRNNRNKKHL